MGETWGGSLSRDELALVKYYRGLSMQKQFEILETAEASFNVAQRMEELAGRKVETASSPDEVRWS